MAVAEEIITLSLRADAEAPGLQAEHRQPVQRRETVTTTLAAGVHALMDIPTFWLGSRSTAGAEVDSVVPVTRLCARVVYPFMAALAVRGARPMEVPRGLELSPAVAAVAATMQRVRPVVLGCAG